MPLVRLIIHRIVTFNTGLAERTIGASCMGRYILCRRIGALQ